MLDGGSDAIPNTELRNDDAQPSGSVSYSVTGSHANGQLELTSAPGTAITTFTQPDIDSSMLVYVHDASNTTSDSFDIEVDDGPGNVLLGQSFAITVTPSTPVTLEVRVGAIPDDAEDQTSGRVALNSNHLQLVLDKDTQTVGMRFNGVTIPRETTILSAYVQFKVDQTGSETTALNIQGKADGNALTFVNSTGNISNRARTATKFSWALEPWTQGEAGPNQQTPNITSVIQAMVNRPTWSSGNSLTIIITGTGKRVAESYNGDQAGAPLLHVEYTSGS